MSNWKANKALHFPCIPSNLLWNFRCQSTTILHDASLCHTIWNSISYHHPVLPLLMHLACYGFVNPHIDQRTQGSTASRDVSHRNPYGLDVMTTEPIWCIQSESGTIMGGCMVECWILGPLQPRAHIKISITNWLLPFAIVILDCHLSWQQVQTGVQAWVDLFLSSLLLWSYKIFLTRLTAHIEFYYTVACFEFFWDAQLRKSYLHDT